VVSCDVTMKFLMMVDVKAILCGAGVAFLQGFCMTFQP